METSEKGWLRVDLESPFWIPCPVAFPDGMTREAWATEAAGAWWQQSGLTYTPTAVGQLAQMLALAQEHGYARVPCHQIWIYLRDPATPPLPVHIGIWSSEGEREQRFRLLAGADDRASVRKPEVSEVETANLGGGLRVLRYRKSRKGALVGLLAYAFRSQECETDLQILAGSNSLSELTAAYGDIDDFVRGLIVYPNTSKPEYA